MIKISLAPAVGLALLICCVSQAQAEDTSDGSCGASNGAGSLTAPSANLCSVGTPSAVEGDGPWTWSCGGSGGGSTAWCSAPVLVNGSCGSSSGADFLNAPSAYLCSAGEPSSVAGDGPWTWSCAGWNGGSTASCSALLAVNGSCGSSNETGFLTAPSANLCGVGAPSSVVGDGPWTWSCAGSNGGVTASCRAQLTVNGSCGSSNGADFLNAPSAYLCGAGAPSSVTGTGPWNWSCAGRNGGATASCSALPVINGSCGSANDADALSAPTTNLCSSGTASQVGGEGPWNWTCAGSNGGAAASCSDTLEINGACGPSNGADALSAPTTNLCNAGIPSQVAGTGPWNWTCSGSNGGSLASCSELLTVNGFCGLANGVDALSAPTTGLCISGTASQVAGTGPWTWTCAGSNGGLAASCSDFLTVNGFCGLANGAGALSAPTTGLCISGTASQVAGTGPWNWTCAGSNGGSSTSCSDLVMVNGSCGPANDTDASSAPTTNLCSAGTASQVGGVGPWNWTCAGSNGGSLASCSDLLTVNGSCGPANGADALSAPTTNLCSVGAPSKVAGTGPWNWTCAGSNGGSSSNCTDILEINGSCGPANGADASSAPTTGLCSAGAASQVGGVGPWNWTCAGSNGGSPASCSDLLTVNGSCGPANGADALSAPTTGLCSVGAASQVGGEGPWNWTCAGSNGGSPASCSDLLTVNGSCGPANGADALSAPTTNLCSAGAPSQVGGTGPWNWTCAGSNGGSPASCSDILMVNGFCGLASGADALSAPTTNLCISGVASQVAGTGPWSWTCAGSNGGASSNCNDILEINGSCGPANGADASSAPTTGLCSAGAASQVGGVGPWNWTCAGSNGGSPASCSDLLTVNGSCGPANGADALSAPTTGLCSVGAASQVGGEGPWNWTCAGSNGGSPASCSDLLTVNGSCGPANGADALSAPTTNLCSAGAPSQVGGVGPWNWTCAGSNGGSPASCSDLLMVNGSCGPANNADAASAPTTNLCSVGAASQVGGEGPWNWTCAGSNGGSPASCSDLLTVNGSCGSANNADASIAPTTGLCSVGNASQVAGVGPWNWTCAGSNGGSPASCSDLLMVNGYCGLASGADALSAPTTNLCSSGTASQVMGVGPWNWTCAGSYGGSAASCSDSLEINGACGPANGTVEIEPTTGFCNAGTASQITGDGPWSWTCTGSNGGSLASCTASLIPFKFLTPSWSSFSPGGFSDYPTLATPNGLVPSVGWQDGVFVNQQAIYFPWGVLPSSGTGWEAGLETPQSVILAYNGSAETAGFNDVNNWSWFNLTTLNWQGKGTLPNTPAGYTGGAVDGNMVYPAPNGQNADPIFIAYDSSQPLTSPAAYQTFVPPPTVTPKGGTPSPGTGSLGPKYGWCEAVSDGRYVYYVPNMNPSGYVGNIVRYDTTQPFSTLSSWSAFNMQTKINQGAAAFQSAVYDGYRFVYYIPFRETLIVRYDSWGGGSAPNPSAFTNAASYTLFDPTQLNTTGHPTVSGQGSPANLVGFTGAAVAWDSAHANEYLYLVPWGSFPNNQQNPVLQSTTARVRIGTQSGSTWTYVDFTSTTTSAAAAPNWELYDLSQLTINPAWPTTWPTVYPASVTLFAGQSTIAGWQIAFVTTTPLSMVGFVPDASQYLVEQNVDHDLFDPSGWYVAPPVPAGYHEGTMGGPYDPVNQILYPAAPGDPLFAVRLAPSAQ